MMYVWSWQQNEPPGTLQEPVWLAPEPLLHWASETTSVLQYPAAGGVTAAGQTTEGFIM